MSSEHTDRTPELRLEKQGATATLWIDHPTRLNAMNFDMWASIPRFLDELQTDDRIRVLVLRGAGGKAFSSGADISQFGERRSTEEGVRLWNSTVESSVARLAAFPKPVVALIQGVCFGGGMGLALHCDLRYALEGASFSIPAARLGVAYYPSWLQRLTALVGPAVAKEIMFTARRYDTSQAQAAGLINTVVSEAEAMDAIARIASLAPLTHRASKMAIDEAARPGLYGAQPCEDAVLACFRSEDYKEGRAAFGEKRPPSFQGR
jgi:enoyl-CoA hydratase/carnithine racemase